jgi:type II secretory pathway pseudopilin PulG
VPVILIKGMIYRKRPPETAHAPRRLRQDAGYTYMFVMFMVVLIGLAATAVTQQWKTEIRREREAELLFRGDQIRQAIGLYYLTARAGVHRYPKSLEDLIKDPNSSATRRYLRKLYKDPITGEDFELVKVGDALEGVRSKSTATPLKTDNFPPNYQEFAAKTSYHDWIFIYQAQGIQPKPVG